MRNITTSLQAWINPKLKENKNIYFKIFGIFAITRILIFLTGYISDRIVAKGEWYFSPNSIIDLFFKWDSGWYLNIVNNGYLYEPGKQSSVAFFPLYPLLVKAFSLVFGHPEIIGFLISNTALFFACVYFYKLVKLDFKGPIAIISVFLLLISPVSFFFSIFYTEGLFLFLLISCFYHARQKRWLVSSLLGGLATLTKGTIGVLLTIPLLMEYFDIDFRNIKIDLKKIKLNILYLVIVPASLLGFMIYLYTKFGDALLFMHIQTAWNRKLTPITTTLFGEFNHPIIYKVLFLTTIIIAVLSIIYLIYKKVRLSYSVYCILTIVIYLSARLLDSMPRYIGILFPIYLAWTILGNKNKFLWFVIIILEITFLIWFTILFVNGYWFN